MKNIIFTLLFLFIGSVYAAPILVNGSLTGSISNGNVPTGWNVSSPSPDTMDQNNNVGVSGLGGFQATPSASLDGGTWVGFAREGSFIESFGQTISGFDIGTSYDLSWYHANFGYDLGYNGANAVQVLLDNTVIGGGSLLALSTAWIDEMISFTATSLSHRIDFQLQYATKSYHSIDGIRLAASDATIPEPATLALFGLGLAGFGFSRKNKSA